MGEPWFALRQRDRKTAHGSAVYLQFAIDCVDHQGGGLPVQQIRKGLQVALAVDMPDFDTRGVAIEFGGGARRKESFAEIMLARLGIQKRGQLS